MVAEALPVSFGDGGSLLRADLRKWKQTPVFWKCHPSEKCSLHAATQNRVIETPPLHSAENRFHRLKFLSLGPLIGLRWLGVVGLLEGCDSR